MWKNLILSVVLGFPLTFQAMEENLADPQWFTNPLSWCSGVNQWITGTSKDISIHNGILRILSGKNGNWAAQNLSLEFSVATAFNISFYCKTATKASFTWNFAHQEKRLSSSGAKQLPATGDWQLVTYRIPALAEAMSLRLSFQVYGNNAPLEIRDLKIIAVDPPDEGRNPFRIDGKTCEAIIYSRGADAEAFYDRKCARILQAMIYQAHGNLIPIRATSVPVKLNSAIYIGKSAEVNGLITRSDISKLNDGGCFFRVRNGNAGIVGKRPGGVPFGALEFLRQCGIFYLTQSKLIYPDKLAIDSMEKLVNPAVALRNNVEVPFMERLGYTDMNEFANGRKLGVYREGVHSIPKLVPYDEFHGEHPEYFALDKEGKRLLRLPGQRFDVHYCVSNEEVARIAAARLVEFFKSEPNAGVFCIYAGDGGGKECCCSNCLKLGSPSTRNILWMNTISTLFSKEFPDKKLITLAYATTSPPAKAVPHHNLYVAYCPYDTSWLNHFIAHCKENEAGWQEMKGWETLAPENMAAFSYPVFYRERLNTWTVFPQNYELCRYFAEKNYRAVMFCGYRATYGAGGYPASHSFADMGIYLLNRVMIDPRIDISREIDVFMKLYYGPAAPQMRQYFNRMNQEAAYRKWDQNCERILRGFITKELADQTLAIFSEAEKQVKGNPEYLERVEREKLYLLWQSLTDNCRGNGKIGPTEFSQYAERIGEFCRIAARYKIAYMQVNPRQWFWETAVIKLGNTIPWFNDPLIHAIIQNPQKALGESIPNAQQKMAYGWLIQAQGAVGGENAQSTWKRKKTKHVKILRRPSSGLGQVQLSVRLAQALTDKAILAVEGIDNEKTDPAFMRLIINGKTIHDGPVPWGKNVWTEEKFEIPPGLLVKGDNTITILNTTADKEKDGVGGINYQAKRNHYWGWFMISDTKIYLHP